MFKTQIKHKAMHGGYKQKPSKQSVNAVVLMYMECHEITKTLNTKNAHKQLKLEL